MVTVNIILIVSSWCSLEERKEGKETISLRELCEKIGETVLLEISHSNVNLVNRWPSMPSRLGACAALLPVKCL